VGYYPQLYFDGNGHEHHVVDGEVLSGGGFWIHFRNFCPLCALVSAQGRRGVSFWRIVWVRGEKHRSVCIGWKRERTFGSLGI
jgi:hypothetical protein